MTLPPSLSDLDPEAEQEPELSRLTLVIGGLAIDVGLPANVRIADYVRDVIDIANQQIAVRDPSADVEFDDTDGKWTLARVGGEPIDPHHSLSDAGIFDGELLMIREAGRPVSPLLFDDVDSDIPDESAVRGWLARNAAALTCFGVALAATTTLAGTLPRRAGDPWVPAGVLALGVLGVLVACVMAVRPATAPRSAWVAAVAFPLVLGGSLYLVPDGFGATSLPMAFALTALSALLVLVISGAGRALHTGVIAACTFGVASATATLLWQPPIRTVGAILATASVIVVYLAPRVTIALSKLPIPRVPTAGEPLDDIETQGGTTVEGVNAIGKQIIPTEEGLTRRVRRANEYLTGILIAAALAAAVGCYLAADVTNGFFWQGTAFAASGSDRDVSARTSPPRFGALRHPHRNRYGDRYCRHREDGGEYRRLADTRDGGVDHVDRARRRVWAGRAASGILTGHAALGRDHRVHRDRDDLPTLPLDHPVLRVLQGTAHLSAPRQRPNLSLLSRIRRILTQEVRFGVGTDQCRRFTSSAATVQV